MVEASSSKRGTAATVSGACVGRLARARAPSTRVFVCSHRFALSRATLPHLHRDWAHPTHICTGTDRTLLQSGTCVSMAASCAKHTCTHARSHDRVRLLVFSRVRVCTGHASAVRPASRSSSFSPMHAMTCRPARNAHKTPRACNVQHGSTRTMQCHAEPERACNVRVRDTRALSDVRQEGNAIKDELKEY